MAWLTIEDVRQLSWYSEEPGMEMENMMLASQNRIGYFGMKAKIRCFAIDIVQEVCSLHYVFSYFCQGFAAFKSEDRGKRRKPRPSWERWCLGWFYIIFMIWTSQSLNEPWAASVKIPIRRKHPVPSTG